jgi:perosamine synthetase
MLNKELNNLIEKIKFYHNDVSYIPLCYPRINENTINTVNNCLRSNYVSTVGVDIENFENKIGELLDRHVVAVVNGTSALKVSYLSAGIKAGDLVFVPNVTFIATVSALIEIGAYPIPIDIDEHSCIISEDALKHFINKNCHFNNVLKLRSTKKIISALVTVDTFGNLADSRIFKDIADFYNLVYISDSAPSLGALRENNITSGNYADYTVISFNGNKVLTSGGGGLIASHDKNKIESIRYLISTAKKNIKYKFEHDQYGYNLRMPAINASLGLGQLSNLDERLIRNNKLNYDLYESFKDIKNYEVARFKYSNYWVNRLIIGHRITINDVIEELENNQIQARYIYQPISHNPLYNKYKFGLYPNSNRVYSNSIIIPGG